MAQFRRWGIAIAAAVIGQAPVRAAPAAAEGGAGPCGTIDEAALRKIRTERAWRVITELRLDETTSLRVLAIFAAYDARELGLRAERRAIVRELRAEIAALQPDDARISKLVELFLDAEARRRRLRTERIGQLRAVLSPTRQARLLLVLPRLGRDVACSLNPAIEGGARSGARLPDAAAAPSTGAPGAKPPPPSPRPNP